MSSCLEMDMIEREESIFCDFCMDETGTDKFIHVSYIGDRHPNSTVFIFCVEHLSKFLQVIKELMDGIDSDGELFAEAIVYGSASKYPNFSTSCDCCETMVNGEDKVLILNGSDVCVVFHDWCVEYVFDNMENNLDKEEILTELL